jgi:hypothetical protein
MLTAARKPRFFGLTDMRCLHASFHILIPRLPSHPLVCERNTHIIAIFFLLAFFRLTIPLQKREQ